MTSRRKAKKNKASSLQTEIADLCYEKSLSLAEAYEKIMGHSYYILCKHQQSRSDIMLAMGKAALKAEIFDLEEAEAEAAKAPEPEPEPEPEA
tara:strand:- start:1784 stop:2062 length:279 start_codon:yes stop_codon:yes gene_type:complete